MRLFTTLFLFAIYFTGYSNPCDTTKEKIKSKTSRTILSNNTPTIDASKGCDNIASVTTIIEEAISVGAPTYNEGNHIACYRTYEGAAYKILYKYGSKCKQVKNILEAALDKSYGDYSATEKAWIMRMAFDQILGVPTITK